MYSISDIAKLSKLTSRTLRHYEEKGLLGKVSRDTNGYRSYPKDVLELLQRIQNFKELNFSLDEIKSLLEFEQEDLKVELNRRLKAKLNDVTTELDELKNTQEKIQNQILTTDKFLKGKSLDEDQRRIVMETIKKEIIENLNSKRKVSEADLAYLEREEYLMNTPEKRKFLEGVKKCLEFAKDNNIRLGPSRGVAPASLSLYALGWGDFDPREAELVPERLEVANYHVHIDVEFENGQKFVDFCKFVSMDLPIGRIEAFKLPILDIIENVHKAIGHSIDYQSYDNNDPLILDQFRKGDIENIFSFDIPANTLVAKYYDPFIREGKLLPAFKEYLTSQDIYDFKDLLNIEAIFRPDNLATKPFMREYIDRYPIAKKEGFSYKSLSIELNEYLKPNYGVIIYQEDIIKIIHHYTEWNYQKCNQFRRTLSLGEQSQEDRAEFLKYASTDVWELLVRETPVVFCKAHSVGSWSSLVKATAILKAEYNEIYLSEIAKWEATHSYSWGDFGFIANGVSLLQQ